MMPNSASTERPSILTPESWRNQKRYLEMALRGKNAWDVVLHGPRELATKRTSEKAQILSLASPDELTGAAASPASAPSVKSETERKDSDHAPDPKDTTSPPLTAVVEPAKSLQWQRIFARELDMARKQDGIALSMISFRLPALVVDTIGPQETAQQLWRRMDAKYSSSSASAHSFLAEEWTGFRMTDTEDIRGQLDKYHSLHTRMQQAELHMPQGVVLAHLLQSLPPATAISVPYFVKHAKLSTVCNLPSSLNKKTAAAHPLPQLIASEHNPAAHYLPTLANLHTSPSLAAKAPASPATSMAIFVATALKTSAQSAAKLATPHGTVLNASIPSPKSMNDNAIILCFLTPQASRSLTPATCTHHHLTTPFSSSTRERPTTLLAHPLL